MAEIVNLPTIDLAHKLHCDREIRNKHSTLLCRFHLIPALMDELILTGIYTVPTNSRLEDFLSDTPKAKADCEADGIECLAYEPHYVDSGHGKACVDFKGKTKHGLLCHRTRPHSLLHSKITILHEGANYKLIFPWKQMFLRCGIHAMAVISLWAYYENCWPHFIFSLDGYTHSSNEYPPPTNMEKADLPEQKIKNSGCRCTIQ